MTHPHERALEAVYAAIKKAEDTHHRDFGLHDYTSYGRPIPHVVRDYRVREGSQTLFESVDAEAAQAFHQKHRAQYVARAAVTAYLAALQDTHALVTMSDDDALRLSADIYDGMLSEPSSPRSKLLGSFEAKTELSAAPGAVEEIRDHLTALKAHTPGPWVFEGTRLMAPNAKTEWEDAVCVVDVHGAMSGNTAADSRLIAAAPDLLEVAKAYERWEADLILDADAWRGRDLPTISQAIWDRLIEIQALRNAAIARAMIDAAPPAQEKK
jgi:hypothetical protein